MCNLVRNIPQPISLVFEKRKKKHTPPPPFVVWVCNMQSVGHTVCRSLLKHVGPSPGAFADAVTAGGSAACPPQPRLHRALGQGRKVPADGRAGDGGISDAAQLPDLMCLLPYVPEQADDRDLKSRRLGGTSAFFTSTPDYAGRDAAACAGAQHGSLDAWIGDGLAAQRYRAAACRLQARSQSLTGCWSI